MLVLFIWSFIVFFESKFRFDNSLRVLPITFLGVINSNIYKYQKLIFQKKCEALSIDGGDGVFKVGYFFF